MTTVSKLGLIVVAAGFSVLAAVVTSCQRDATTPPRVRVTRADPIVDCSIEIDGLPVSDCAVKLYVRITNVGEQEATVDECSVSAFDRFGRRHRTVPIFLDNGPLTIPSESSDIGLLEFYWTPKDDLSSAMIEEMQDWTADCISLAKG